MQLTPTDKGAGFAGIMLASIGWLSLFKLDHVAELCHVDRWVKAERLFEWIIRNYRNKAFTLLVTEIINFSVHGITNPASVLFACGSTVVNSFMIFIGLPIKMKISREKSIKVMAAVA